MDESLAPPLAAITIRLITDKEHLTKSEFYNIYHKHITNAMSDSRSA